MRATGIAVCWMICALAGASPGVAANEWQGVLAGQLMKEKRCVLLRVTSVQEFELLGARTIRADAHCLDGRVFTVTQETPHEKFILTACPTRC